MKKYISLLTLIVCLVFPVSVGAFSAETSRITYNDMQQNGPVIYKNVIMWTDWRGPGGLNIYAYNLDTQEEYPLVVSEYHDRVISHNQNYVLYGKSDPLGLWGETRVIDLQSNEDYKVLDNALAGELEQHKFPYTLGDDLSLYVFDLKTNTSQYVADQAYTPMLSGKYIVWTINRGSGWYDIRAYDLVKEELVELPPVPESSFRAVVDFYKGEIVYNQFIDGVRQLIGYNLKTGKSRLFHEAAGLGGAQISDNYLVWGRSTDKHVAGVEGMDLKTGEIIEIVPQGGHSNAAVALSLYKETAAFMLWRTGNGDIYMADMDKK